MDNVNIEELEEILKESLNPWLKDLLTETLRQQKQKANHRFEGVYKAVYLIKADLLEQRKLDKELSSYSEEKREKTKLIRVYSQKDIVKQERDNLIKRGNVY